MTSVHSYPDVSADKQTALLLAAPLWKRPKNGPAPLTGAEYREFVAALYAEGIRPGDLLRPDAHLRIPALVARLPARFQERVTHERLVRLLERGGQLALALSHWASAGIWVVSRADDGYPLRYKKKLGRSAPPIIYGIGAIELLEHGGLAVVGSREPDESSERYVSKIGEWAAINNVQVVSGAARGVDEGAMLACVRSGGTSLGVVAESLLRLSTRKDFREAIVAKRMTLISSFDPDAGFTVPNAMARNRWIYALADRALVVASSNGSGGTWAGAIEALKHGEKVYVRIEQPALPGNAALVAYGAIPAPPDFSQLWADAVVPETLATTPAVSALPSQRDVFALIAPVLLEHLQIAQSAKQLALRLDITPGQTTAWLKRLCEDGRVEKVGIAYIAKMKSVEQASLFN